MLKIKTLILLIVLSFSAGAALRMFDGPVQVGDRVKPDASAVLQIDSTTQGFVPPRMTTAERTAIATPITGIQVYNTDTNQVEYYNGGGWVASGSSVGIPQWTTATSYVSGQIVHENNKIYKALTTHTSGVFATDLTNNDWVEISDDMDTIGSSTDNALMRWDGTSGGIPQDSVAILDDVGVLSGLTQISVDNLTLDGNTISSTDVNGNIILNPNGTGNINFPDLTASRPLSLDGSNNVTAAALDISSSNNVTGVLPIANGGTNSSTALNNNRVMISSGSAVVEHSALTTGSVLFADANGLPGQDNAKFFYDNTTDVLGLGTVSPLAKITISGVGGNTSQIDNRAYSNNSNSFPAYRFKRAQGSEASPSRLNVVGTRVGQMDWLCHNGVNFVECAKIEVKLVEDYASTRGAAKIEFNTDPIGSGVSTLALTLEENGTGTFENGVEVKGTLSSKLNVFTPKGTQVIAAVSDTLASANTNLDISGASNFTMTSTPTITAGSDGQYLIVHNSGANSVTLQDDSVLAGSDLFLGGSNISLASKTSLAFIYSTGTSGWVAIGGTGGGSGGGISAWLTATDYTIGDVVHESNKIYLALITHTSGTFATDLAANNWIELSDDLNREISVTDNAITRWDGTGGDDVQNSLVTIDDIGVMAGLTQLTVDNLSLDGNTISSTNVNGDIVLNPNGTGNVTLPDLTASAPLYLNASNEIKSTAMTNGQLIIGSTGVDPAFSTLTGTANQVVITDGAGTITLSTPQDIHTGASPTFAGGTFTGPISINSNAANTSAITTFENTAGNFQIFRTDSTPESSVTGSIGDISVDGTNGKIYLKNSGAATTTGWLEIGSDVTGVISSWVTSTAYLIGDVVYESNKIYRALINHTSGVFATDLAANNWIELSDDLNRETSVTDNAITRWDGTGGDDVQNSLVTIDDAGIMSGATQFNVDNLRLDGNTVSSTDVNGNINLSPNGTGDVVLTGFTTNSILFVGTSAAVSEDNVNFSYTDGTDTLLLNGIFNIDNLRMDGNTLSSTDTNGNILLDPNGTGDIQTRDNASIDLSNTANTFFTKLVAVSGLAADYTLTLPVDGGAEGQRLITDGSGTTSWEAPQINTQDTFFSESFEITNAADYTTGNNAAFDNGGVIGGVLSDDTITEINGLESLKFTMNAISTSSDNDWVASPVIALAAKHKGQFAKISFYSTYNGADGDVKLVVYDDTGSLTLTSDLDIIKASTEARKHDAIFFIPATSSNLKWGFQVVTGNSSKILTIDDVELSLNAFGEASLLESQTYDLSQVQTAITNRALEVEFNLATATITNSGPELITATDDSGNTRTKFIANVSSLVTVSAYGRITTAQNGVCILVNGLVVVNGSAHGTGSNGMSTVSARFDLVKDDYISLGTCKGDNILFDSMANTGAVGGIRLVATAKIDSITTTGILDVQDYDIFTLQTGLTDRTNEIEYNLSTSTIVESGPKFVRAEDDSGSTRTKWIANTKVKINVTGGGRVTSANGQICIAKGGSVLAMGSGQSGSAGHSNAGISFDLDKDEFFTIANCLSDRSISGSVQNTTSGSWMHFRAEALETPVIAAVSRRCIITDVKSTGTNAGTCTSGSYVTRDLNTISGDCSFVTLTTNEFALQPGIYNIKASAPGYKIDNHKARLYNVTGSVVRKVGTAARTAAADSIVTRSFIEDYLTLTSATQYRIEHRCQTTQASSGFGNSTAFGGDEIYTTVTIDKVK